MWLSGSCRAWWLALLLLLTGGAPLQAHTFTTLGADLLFEDDELSLTLGLHLLDALAIIEGKPVSASNTLTATQLRAHAAVVRAYLVEHVRLRVDGKLIAGSCPGYVPDLISPPKPGDEPAEILPERVPFLLIWTLPKDTKSVEIEFALLVDLVGSGVVNASLHQGDRTQSQYTNLGGTVSLTLRGASPVAKPALSTKPTPAAGTTSVTAPAAAIPNTEEEPKLTSAAMSVHQLLAMGFHHIIPEGLDHILFVVCLFLLAPRMKPLLIQVTAFTLAHSVTLGLAMAGLVLLPSRLVETLIAASIVVMAVENIFMREVKPWRWILVFLFGLIHGLGFAGSFTSLQMQPGDFARPLILLNLGIEIAQLSVVAACAALTWWMWQRPWYTRFVIQPASVTIALIAAWWTIQRAFALG
jgi:HupE / UreJ protein